MGPLKLGPKNISSNDLRIGAGCLYQSLPIKPSSLAERSIHGYSKSSSTGSRGRQPIYDSSREDQEKEGSRMSYISGARSVPDEQVRIASTKMDGIGPKKAIQVRYRLGISGNIKMNELTKYQIDQIEQMIGQDHVVHWELKRGERADIERLISISCYRGIRHQDGSPLRGQRTHTNARTCRKRIRK